MRIANARNFRKFTVHYTCCEREPARIRLLLFALEIFRSSSGRCLQVHTQDARWWFMLVLRNLTSFLLHDASGKNLFFLIKKMCEQYAFDCPTHWNYFSMFFFRSRSGVKNKNPSTKVVAKTIFLLLHAVLFLYHKVESTFFVVSAVLLLMRQTKVIIQERKWDEKLRACRSRHDHANTSNATDLLSVGEMCIKKSTALVCFIYFFHSLRASLLCMNWCRRHGEAAYWSISLLDSFWLV